MKRLAIPIADNQLSEFFRKCAFYEVFDIENGKVVKHQSLYPDTADVSKLPRWAKDNGFTDIVTYKISSTIIAAFSALKINLFVGVSPAKPNDIVADYITGNLKSNNNIICDILSENNKTLKK